MTPEEKARRQARRRAERAALVSALGPLAPVVVRRVVVAEWVPTRAEEMLRNDQELGRRWDR